MTALQEKPAFVLTRHEDVSLLPLERVLSSVRGELVSGSGEFGFFSVCIDSRRAVKHSLFAALVGEKQNGHDYIPQAIEKGASVIFAQKSDYAIRYAWYKNLFAKNSEVFFILADNTLTALQDAAASYVEQFPALIRIGITGSSGKTTTKEIAFSLVSQKYNTVCSEGNLNTETGLPLSVFKIRKEHEAGIFELGMNRKHEITEIARVLNPRYAVVTNIGSAHVGLLGSIDAIAYEKKQIFSNFDGECTAIIPKDDAYADFLSEGVPGTLLYYSDSLNGLTALGIKDVINRGIDGTGFVYEGESVSFALPGAYNFKNLLAALTLSRALNLSHDEIVRGIISAKPYFGRSQILRGDVTIIQDCYNANPSSMTAALDFFKSIDVRGKKIAVLGDMFELGDEAPASHELVVSQALDSDIETVVLIGKEMSGAFLRLTRISRAAAKAKNVIRFDSWDDEHIAEAADSILHIAKKGDTVLIKGSRSTALERLSSRLEQALGLGACL
jgi:UDP-N-acetylmuramoyl-tripeptide--D-alanyl-D-alanine ligase